MRTRPALACAALLAGTLVTLSGTAAHAATTRYEAEGTSASCNGSIETEWPGYSGDGFCDTENEEGAHVQFSVNAPASGTATLTVRFANGTSSARPADVLVNGSRTASVSFEGTGDWDAWTTKTLTVQLAEGANTIRFDPTGSQGMPNVDYLDVETSGGGDDGGGDDGGGDDGGGDDGNPPTSDALYVAPGGSAGADGTESDPTTLTSAIDRIEPGGTIHMRGGTYSFSDTVTIPLGEDGTSGNRTELSAYPGETPVLDFSAQSEDSANRGLALEASYWHVEGIVVEHAGDNGIFVSGSHNVIERTVTRFNRDTGLQLSRRVSSTPESDWPAHNLILSAESHDNADSDGEDADGFAAKLTSGPGNVFRYAVAHNNIDDGWDLYTKDDTGPIGTVTIEDSLAYENGILSDGSQAGNGDRNGFKLGGEDIGVDHVITGNIAYDNGKHGFTYNSNPGSMTVSDNVSIGNEERNFNFDDGSSVFRGNTSCDSGSNDRIIGNADSSNQFWSGSNGSRCSSYDGGLDWSYAADGTLVVTFGGQRVTP
ncbi:carbohydrate-binding protein [Nocardiopsis dassonvillei]|uniref:Pectate disaccharide-lyase n=1 Tax=Nocardiopsis dassonvillei (strain ATCC 23218 / DSM 43111 / CIP 107115 / JCM 7437 / KCTC 9190 / NBRC 14626 / NCTC 10488 / NRRL B-5397 / IMRU 509) TaxID=446468 RepID=D7B160_NOCDD|nr:CBM35 domain-containing protein [Nocardiopsis dassonvillei]ADH66451.1 Pectate disaccharide-lyase [Nocardiopsis dassonvillei subsp. dassonvillei DSM 43111]NKY77810.1 carbohydrate-binding protein [Nocardiopsis dassonvillei]VEI92472.1 Pectate disaccharide-lyase precursor [Nocardiopsis dassonvillei]